MSDVTTDGTETANEQTTVVTDNANVVTPTPTPEPAPAPQPHVSFLQHYVLPALLKVRAALAWVEGKIQPWRNEIWAAYLVILAVVLVAFAPKVTLAALGAVVLTSGWIAYYGLRKRIKANGGA